APSVEGGRADERPVRAEAGESPLEALACADEVDDYVDCSLPRRREPHAAEIGGVDGRDAELALEVVELPLVDVETGDVGAECRGHLHHVDADAAAGAD